MLDFTDIGNYSIQAYSPLIKKMYKNAEKNIVSFHVKIFAKKVYRKCSLPVRYKNYKGLVSRLILP
jgi:hypothetical protein